MSRTPLLLILSAVLTAALVVPASAVDYLVTDVAEDSNGINSQGFAGLAPVAGPDDTALPVGIRHYDILGLRYVPITETTEVNGQEVTEVVGLESRLAMTLDPATGPVPGIVRLVHSVNGCDMQMQYFGGLADTLAGTGNIRLTCEGDVTTSYPVVAEGDALDVHFDSTNGEIVWAYTFGTGAAADSHFEPLFGGPVTIVPGESHTRVRTAATAPALDEMGNDDGVSFTFGEDA